MSGLTEAQDRALVEATVAFIAAAEQLNAAAEGISEEDAADWGERHPDLADRATLLVVGALVAVEARTPGADPDCDA